MNKYKILITGGNSGIGFALAKELSIDGHTIVVCARKVLNLENVLKINENILHYSCDVSNEKSVIGFLNFVKKKFNYIDVIVNCAGVQGAIGRFDKTNSSDWKEAFETNTFGTYLITKYFLDLLLQSNIKKIINFSGGGAFSAFPNYSAYAVSKAAVVRFTENIAEELKDLGVQVNCVAPGFVATKIHDATLNAGEKLAGEQYKKVATMLKEGSVPMKVVVDCVKFLISPESNGLTGKTISANFDKWNTKIFQENIKIISDSDLYTMKRINLVNLDEDDELRMELINP